jgi:hypothetical protein
VVYHGHIFPPGDHDELTTNIGLILYDGIMVLLSGITTLIGGTLGFIFPGSSLDMLFKNPENINDSDDTSMVEINIIIQPTQVNSLETTWN